MMPSEDPPDKTILTDKQLDILNDHYKDTFTRLRESEQTRDRLFLWLIGLIVLLILEIGYPVAVGGALGKVKFADAEVNLQALPLAALLNATWILTLLIGLQYCQATVRVNRQYPYLHSLEDTVSPSLGGGDTYQREGRVYLRDYPLLLDVAWFVYSIFFPFAVICSTIWLIHSEIFLLNYNIIHQLIDVFIGATLCIVFFVYRLHPAITDKFRDRNNLSSSNEEVIET